MAENIPRQIDVVPTKGAGANGGRNPNSPPSSPPPRVNTAPAPKPSKGK